MYQSPPAQLHCSLPLLPDPGPWPQAIVGTLGPSARQGSHWPWSATVHKFICHQRDQPASKIDLCLVELHCQQVMLLGPSSVRGDGEEHGMRAQHVSVEMYPTPLSPEDAASPALLYAFAKGSESQIPWGGTVPASPSRMPGLAAASLLGLAGQGSGTEAALPLWDRAGIPHIQQQPLPSAQYGFSQELLLAQYGR